MTGVIIVLLMGCGTDGASRRPDVRPSATVGVVPSPDALKKGQRTPVGPATARSVSTSTRHATVASCGRYKKEVQAVQFAAGADGFADQLKTLRAERERMANALEDRAASPTHLEQIVRYTSRVRAHDAYLTEALRLMRDETDPRVYFKPFDAFNRVMRPELKLLNALSLVSCDYARHADPAP